MEYLTGVANINGTHLYYEVAGSGGQLVLIHGFSLDSRMWDPQFISFTKQYRVIRYDMRGFGKSALPTDVPYTHSCDLRALLDHLEVDQAFILGLSMGGKVAIDFAIEFPERTAALIVADTGLGGYVLQEFGKAVEGVIETAVTSGVEDAKVAFSNLDLFNSSNQIPEVVEKLTGILADYSGWHFINEDPDLDLDPPAVDRLDNIKQPTLIIVGELDSREFHQISNILHKNIQNSQKVVLPGIGHASNLENPREFNDLVLDFLAKL